ncbi:MULTISPECIES: lipocalin family protein [unclassified Acinetobacter]|uniref:lipocalin family protein n=1 Tax=unclassified Acinetobacter TaxID=196816 RepID=UPI0035B8E878
MKKAYKGVVLAGLATAAVVLASQAQAQNTSTNPPQTVTQVDIAKYQGDWYEIARLPMYFQRNCASDSKANYRLNADNTVTVRNQCITKKGKLQVAEGLATSQNPPQNSKLKVTFLPKGLRWLPFGKGDYWILKLDENYQTVLIGGESREYLWVLSRTPNLDEQTYQDYVNTAKQQGYDVSKLIRTPHTQK